MSVESRCLLRSHIYVDPRVTSTLLKIWRSEGIGVFVQVLFRQT